jgi:hypothetical protein
MKEPEGDSHPAQGVFLKDPNGRNSSRSEAIAVMPETKIVGEVRSHTELIVCAEIFS